MKVSILTSVFYQKLSEVNGKDRIIYGGAERYMVELCHWLKSLGHDVTVYQGYQVTREHNEVINKQYKGIDIVCLPIIDKWEYNTCPTLNKMFYEMSLNADLRIYFASFLAYPLVKSPCITINHGIFWDYAGGFITESNEEDRKEFYRRQLFGITEPDMCIAVDTNVRNSIACMYPGKERKIMYIPNFVDINEFYPTKESHKDKIKVLFPRRLVQLRGINEFLVAASELPDYTFCLCGQSFDETADEQFNTYKNKRNVELTMRSMDDMAGVYRDADIAVIPTRASEGTSLSCLEAMASGLPIVTTPAGGLPNLVIDRWNGLVVDLNHFKLSPAIKELAENSELRTKFGERNVQMIKESFSIDLWKYKWSKVLEKIIR
jgi:glycosyltransferase involved in cell wall biosynthesis